MGGDSRSRLDPERANFIVAPAHGLEGGIIIAQLALTAQEVLTLIDSHTALSVVLEGGGQEQNIHEVRSSQSSHNDDVYQANKIQLTAQAMGLKEVILSMW